MTRFFTARHTGRIVDFQSRESRRRVSGEPDESGPSEADDRPDSSETTDGEAPTDGGEFGTALLRVGGNGTAAAVEAIIRPEVASLVAAATGRN
ncbi:hypothetical protein BRC62_02275 [Halobacteriales archaeon QH_10_67_13]|nr:MAG: hypothetical protein BRC62_02275 [Halobacteriales archaeon QH_10_67_13]